MPTSHPMLITPVVEDILEFQPESVLDIGVGFGKWGALTREYTDIWYQRLKYIVKIDGIEIYEKYRNPNWEHYNNIFLGNVIDILPTLQSYDLILFLEVLEHIDKLTALTLINICRTKCKRLIFSYTNTAQGSAFGNVNETHVSQWQADDFHFPMTLMKHNNYTFVYRVKGDIEEGFQY